MTRFNREQFERDDMDSWFDRSVVPPTRYELHYGGSRMVRCFVDRPKSVHEMLSNAVARRPHGVALISGEDAVTYSQLDGLVGTVAGGLKALGVGKGDRVAMVIGKQLLTFSRFRHSSRKRAPALSRCPSSPSGLR
jgi:non-ribosomal peptide synthetase component F